MSVGQPVMMVGHGASPISGRLESHPAALYNSVIGPEHMQQSGALAEPSGYSRIVHETDT